MKRIFLSAIFFFLFLVSIFAQNGEEYSYRPFVMDGSCVWLTRYNPDYPSASDHRRIISNEDSVYNGQTYKKIYDYEYCSQGETDKVCTGIIREADKRIFYLGEMPYGEPLTGEERLIYDFNLEVGEEISFPWSETENHLFTVSRIETLLVEGVWRRKFFFTNQDTEEECAGF